jgi:predicted site-specific integrase-resolvase
MYFGRVNLGKSEQVDIEDYINQKSGNVKVKKYKKRPKDYKALLKRDREPLKVGYARVSTPQQSLEAQVDELVKAGCEVVIAEQTSGSFKKPELMFILDNTIAGDELHVWKLDRLGRDNIEQLLILQKFSSRIAFWV